MLLVEIQRAHVLWLQTAGDLRRKFSFALVKVFASDVDKQCGHFPVHLALTAVMAKPARPICLKRYPMPANRASVSHVRTSIRKESVPSADAGAKERGEGSSAYIELSVAQICSMSERICQLGKELEEFSSGGALSDSTDRDVMRCAHARGSVMRDSAVIDPRTDAPTHTISALPRYAFEPLVISCAEGVR